MEIITRREFLGKAGCGLVTAAALYPGLEKLGIIAAPAQVAAAPADAVAGAGEAALSGHGPGFSIEPAYGMALLPTKAGTATDALRLADRRMYIAKKRRANPAAPRRTPVKRSPRPSPPPPPDDGPVRRGGLARLRPAGGKRPHRGSLPARRPRLPQRGPGAGVPVHRSSSQDTMTTL